MAEPAAATTTEPVKDASASATAAPVIDTTDKDALEIGKLLLDSGIRADQVNDLLAAPQALQSIRYMVENDPQEFIRSLEKSNPGAGENFLDKLSKLYVDRYAPKDDDKGGDKAAPNAELLQKLSELSETVNTLSTQRQRDANAAALAQINARYNARVDDLFGQLPADKFPLSNYEKELIKGKLNADLAADPQIVARVHNGNFVDVPRVFKGIVEGIAADRKSAADAATAAREKATRVALPDFGSGPVDLPKDFYDVSQVPTENLWDEGPLVRILEGTNS